MARTLVHNVRVGDKWYGPSYPTNEVTDEVAEQISNPGAWEGTDTVFDLTERADDVGAELHPRAEATQVRDPSRTEPPDDRPSEEALRKLPKDEVVGVADDEGVLDAVSEKDTKDQIIATILARRAS